MQYHKPSIRGKWEKSVVATCVVTKDISGKTWSIIIIDDVSRQVLVDEEVYQEMKIADIHRSQFTWFAGEVICLCLFNLK